MFGIRLISEKRLNDLESQVKGYYGDTQIRNAVNEYIRAVASVSRGLELRPFQTVDRKSLKQVYQTSAPVMGIINLIAENVGEVMKYLELKDLRTNEYVDRHWLLDLLRKPNDRFVLRKFGTAWAINYCLYGDSYVYAPKAVGKDRGIVKEMYIIPSHRVGNVKGSTENPFAGIQLLGLPANRTIDMDSVFQSFSYNLDDDSYFGTSRVVAAAKYLSVMDKGMNRQDTALDNGGVSNIITPQMAKTSGIVRPSEADSVEKEFNSKSAVGKTKALRYPIEVHTLGNAPVDLNILASHKEAVTALCFVFKIPIDLYYGQSKYENAKEAKKTIYEQNAIPLANEFAEDLLNYCDLSGDYELAVNRDKIDILKPDPTNLQDNLDKIGASLNERREAAGYSLIDEPYANEPMIRMGYQFGNETYDIPGEL